jgi:magnesium transporter
MTDLHDLVGHRDVARILDWLADEHDDHRVSEELVRLPHVERAIVFRLLGKDRALSVFEKLDPSQQAELIEGLRTEEVADLLERIDPDDRAHLLDELPAKVAKRLLAGVSPEERNRTTLLMGYGPSTTGRIMTPEFVTARASETAASALQRIRRAGVDAETIYAVWVLDDERRLLGVVSLKTLVLAQPDDRVRDLMDTDVTTASTDEDQEATARRIQDHDLLAIPVLDRERRLVGIVTFDDAMDVLEEEDTEDIARLGASEPLDRPYLGSSVALLARKRAVWLLVLIVAATLTINVLQYFEETLETVITLALFIPLLIDTGGNAGSQASTVLVRAMAVGEVRFADLPGIVWREARVGVVLGAMLAAIGFVPVWTFFGWEIAVVVCLTLVTICTWATFVGALMPLVARRIGIDPAVVSAPIITTFVDATGLLIYFSIARITLGI